MVEDSVLLAYDAATLGKQLSTFRRTQHLLLHGQRCPLIHVTYFLFQ